MFGLNFFSQQPQWTVSSIPDLSGRVAIVTGGNTGLGYITVRELARKGARVYMLSRTDTRAFAAMDKIKGELGPELNPQVEYINFDLLSLNSAKKAADTFLQKEKRLDILVNNAGIMATPYELGPDGIEIQASNGTGHFALTISLLPLLKTTAAMPDSHVRIVNVSSFGYFFAYAASKPDFSSLEGLNQKTWTTWVRYGRSKLMNILFTNELQKRLTESGTNNIYCLSVHPGGVSTELTRGMKLHCPSSVSLKNIPPGPLQSWPFLAPLDKFTRLFLATPEQGALTQLYAATSLEVEEKDLKAALLSPVAQVATKASLAEDKDGKMGSDFWNLCEALMREKVRD
ncbi:short chain dehydrogenase [Lentinula raphanica]|nr:short chain dehydrogenase [Lentinula raphanica]